MVIKDKRDSLFEIVQSQHGIFTTKQAVDAGYDRNTHPYQVKKGYWIRECRGVYRQAHYHFDLESEYVVWSLWLRNRLDQPQGVYSHETALSIFDLSDLNPSKLHMTVPPTFRKNCGTPDHLVLHKGELEDQHVQDRGGYKVTKPIKSILDLCREETVSRDLIAQAVSEGIKRGLITQREKRAASDSVAFPDWARSLFC
jgi:predicted transcriptional regulator of viral defense system